ncbi:MAG: NAD(P)H-dependent oxidoreductase [Planctomycetota bacterium]
MQIAVICCSLNPESRSTAMAESLRAPLAKTGADIDWIDLREHDLPLCDGGPAYGSPVVQALVARLTAADAAIFALPIYNYDGNAAAKNLIELTGKGVWLNKTVGFLCSAGGRGSFMSIMGLANSLMLDFRCVIVPRFVYADNSDFATGSTAPPADVEARIVELAEETMRMASALSQADAVG